jgi:hypothetical protein
MPGGWTMSMAWMRMPAERRGANNLQPTILEVNSRISNRRVVSGEKTQAPLGRSGNRRIKDCAWTVVADLHVCHTVAY